MSTTNFPSAEVATLVIDLQDIGDQLEATVDRRWIKIARAAALLEALRLGIAIIPDAVLPERWIGIDTAKPGKDSSAHMTGDCHA